MDAKQYVTQCRKHLECVLKAEEHAAQMIVAEAKESANTYANVKNNLDKLIRDVRFVENDWKHYGNILNMAEQLLNEEMGGLPLTNRPQAINYSVNLTSQQLSDQQIVEKILNAIERLR